MSYPFLCGLAIGLVCGGSLGFIGMLWTRYFCEVPTEASKCTETTNGVVGGGLSSCKREQSTAVVSKQTGEKDAD